MIIALDTAHIADANRPNEPFQIIGRLIPTYTHGGWQAEEELLPEPHMKTYEEEEIDWTQYINQPDKHVFLAYEEKQFAGRIVLRRDWNRYAFIEDIAVTMALRGRGVGTTLMRQAEQWAREQGLCGLALETQDTNLLACRFYQKCGMHIGAVNTMLYRNFPKPYCDEIAIFWYKRWESV